MCLSIINNFLLQNYGIIVNNPALFVTKSFGMYFWIYAEQREKLSLTNKEYNWYHSSWIADFCTCEEIKLIIQSWIFLDPIFASA